MELKEFVKETLVQIASGVVEAQEELSETGCLINPEGFVTGENNIKPGFKGEFRYLQFVKMNVQVTVSEEAGNKAGISVASIIKAGVNTEVSSSSNNMTSLEFKIPISLPETSTGYNRKGLKANFIPIN